ncbi:unnamed protein product [Larinioides sclopetarius]|uniref:Uncharacterized protein n=1 Tax=Larinioides sclopetarius TaxID=280406 RepID=A0AAV2B9G0_9ARAC
MSTSLIALQLYVQTLRFCDDCPDNVPCLYQLHCSRSKSPASTILTKHCSCKLRSQSSRTISLIQF